MQKKKKKKLSEELNKNQYTLKHSWTYSLTVTYAQGLWHNYRHIIYVLT